MDSLCYVYLNGDEKKYGKILKENLFDKDIVFNNKYKITYKNNILKIEYNEDYIEEFYKVKTEEKNVKRINSIVGKNGSGKTSLLSFIISIIYWNHYMDMNYLLIFNVDNKIVIINRKCKIEKIDNKTMEKEEIIDYFDDEKMDIYNLIKKNITMIFFSNIASIKNNLFGKTEEDKKYFNISLTSDLHTFFKNKYTLLGNYHIDNKYTDDRFEKDEYEEIKNYRINKNVKYLTYNTLFDIKYILLRLNIYNDIKNFLNTSFDKLRFYKKYSKDHYVDRNIERIEIEPTDKEKEIYKSLISEFIILKTNKDDKSMCKNISTFAIIDAYFNELYKKINNYEVAEAINNEINNIEYTSSETAENKWKKIQNCIQNIKEEKISNAYKKSFLKEQDIEDFIEKNIKLYYSFIKGLNKKYNDLYADIEELFKFEKLDYYMANNGINFQGRPYYSNEPYIFVDISEFNNLYTLISKKNNIKTIFNFDFRGVSSGQQALLDIYSEFFYIKEEINSDNIIVFMDEPELYMHPEWQRKFISLIIKFFNEQFPDKNIQIIYTTNSPYTLSDLQPMDVILLGSKGKITDTFANNIHTLLRNEFFMESTIGELARNKINEIIKDEGKNNIDIKYKDKLINIIGDELIKIKLKEIVSEKNDKN